MNVWEGTEVVAQIKLLDGTAVAGPLDMMRDADGTVYGFRSRFGDRRIYHVGSVAVSIPMGSEVQT